MVRGGITKGYDIGGITRTVIDGWGWQLIVTGIG